MTVEFVHPENANTAYTATIPRAIPAALIRRKALQA